MDNCSIIMNVKQSSDGVTDESQLFTKGEFRYYKGSFYIDYDETEATGYAGSHVQLCIKGDLMVMTRTGKMFSNMIFEGGKRHYCHYTMGENDCILGISTRQMENKLNLEGGEIHLKYSVDINAGLITENEIDIKVKM